MQDVNSGDEQRQKQHANRFHVRVLCRNEWHVSSGEWGLSKVEESGCEKVLCIVGVWSPGFSRLER
jgi:hypothetical protein